MSDLDYVFIVQWFDTAAALIRSYNLTFHSKDNSIQMYDIKNKRVFLKKCEVPGITLKDIFVGAVLNVYSRQLKVADYADQFTRDKLQKQKGKSFAMIKPNAYLHAGKIINILEQEGFSISNLKMIKMSQRQVEVFYAQLRGKPYFKQLVQFISSDLVIGLQVISDNCISHLNEVMGPQNIKSAKSQNPNSIRANFSQDNIKNAIHGSSSASLAAKQIDYFFSPKSTLNCPAVFNNCTCCIIKPHILSQGYLGQVLDQILSAGFQISAMQMFWLDRPSAQEFLQIYKNVVPEYGAMVEQLINGPCVALQIRQQNSVIRFRQFCGSHDPQIAKTVKPKSIRAQFGKDKARNAVHCTDLAEDGLLEVQYFFNILQNK